MDRSLRIVILMVVISTLLDVVYVVLSLIYCRIQKEREVDGNYDPKKTVLVFLMMLFTPVIGELFFGGSVVLQRLIFRRNGNMEGGATLIKAGWNPGIRQI